MENFVKEQVPQTATPTPITRVVIRLNHYGHTLALINSLVVEARKDFPNLTDNDIEITQYGGSRISGTWGIEFDIIGSPIPTTYRLIAQLEYTR